MTTAPAEVPRLFDPILPRVRADLAAQLGTSAVELVPVAYENRPFSHLLRVRARSARPGAERLFFVKIFKSKPDDGGVEKMRRRVANDYNSTRRIAEAMARHEVLGVVQPIACYLDHLAIVTEQAVGETLKEYLEANARWFPSAKTMDQLEDTLSNVGRWLTAFQAVDSVTGPVMLPELQDYVDVRLKRLVAHGAYTEPQRQAVLRHLSLLAAKVGCDELREVLIHADLAPGNVLVSKGRVIVIDLAMVQRGSALHDISRLYLQLDVLRAKPQFRSAVVRRLQRALLHGFDVKLTAELPLFRFLSMLHRFNHLSTLSLNRERFPGSALSWRVLRLHRAWINAELQRGSDAAEAR